MAFCRSLVNLGCVFLIFFAWLVQSGNSDLCINLYVKAQIPEDPGVKSGLFWHTFLGPFPRACFVKFVVVCGFTFGPLFESKVVLGLSSEAAKI